MFIGAGRVLRRLVQTRHHCEEIDDLIMDCAVTQAFLYHLGRQP